MAPHNNGDDILLPTNQEGIRLTLLPCIRAQVDGGRDLCPGSSVSHAPLSWTPLSIAPTPVRLCRCLQAVFGRSCADMPNHELFQRGGTCIRMLLIRPSGIVVWCGMGSTRVLVFSPQVAVSRIASLLVLWISDMCISPTKRLPLSPHIVPSNHSMFKLSGGQAVDVTHSCFHIP